VVADKVSHQKRSPSFSRIAIRNEAALAVIEGGQGNDLDCWASDGRVDD